jgi:intracellular septation protein
MRTALGQLLSDFLSAIVFLVIYGSTDNLYLATGAAIAVSLAQFTVFKMRGQPVDAMQWLVLGMVVILGSATLITEDSRFLMMKPSIVHFAVGAVMLRRGWMMRYLPPIVRENIPESALLAAGYAWAALMFALGALNIVIADAAIQGLGLVHLSGRHRCEDRGFPAAIRHFPHHPAPEAARSRQGRPGHLVAQCVRASACHHLDSRDLSSS